MISKSRKFTTIDVNRKDIERSENRYSQKNNYEPPIRSSTKINSKHRIHQLTLSIDK